jgi:hypothetical protein
MAAPLLTLDEREPRGIIIQAGTPRQAGVPFRAYLWSDGIDPGACVGARRGRILESAPLPGEPNSACRASP